MIRRAKIILAAALLVGCASLAYAQSKSLPTVKVDGKEYYYYDVQPKETLFSISKNLGISRESIIEANPQVADGLQAYTRLYFPVETSSATTKTAATATAKTHKVKHGDTLYGISKTYGLTVDQLLALNPSARDGIKTGDELIVSASTSQSKATKAAVTETKTAVSSTKVHTIEQGETLYRIATDNGVSVESLLAANPGLDAGNYSAGTQINIPGTTASASDATPAKIEAVKPVTNSSTSASSATPAKAPTPTTKTTVESLPRIIPDPEVKITGDLHIALMLPLMLNQETPSKSAELYTDFYKGFLLAADTLSRQGSPVRIHVYDTANSVDTIKALMQRPEMQKMHVIVGPDNEQQLAAVINYADADETFIFNMFAPKDESYLTCSNVIQANIPHDEMYEKAANAFLSKFAERQPVFLSRVGGNAEKDEFTSILKKRLNDRQKPYREISYRDVLSDEELSVLAADSSFVFIPISAARSEFVKITPALKQLANDNPYRVALFGYPEWLTFRGESEDDLGKLNATVYSRFYNDESYYAVRRVMDNFNRWYGKAMRPSVPSQGILGFDVGCYLIKAVRTNGGDFHLKKFDFDGLQTSFILDDSEVEGLVNTSLLLISFSQDSPVVSIKI
jgi:LysM repeat protein